MRVVELEDVKITILPEVVRDAPSIFDAIGSVIDAVKSAVYSALSSLYYDYIEPGLRSVADWVKDKLKPLIDPITNWVRGIWDWIRSFVQALYNAVRYPLTLIWNALTGLATRIWSALSTVGSYITNAIRTAIATLSSIISSVISKVWSTLSSVGSWIKDGIINLANRIWSVISSVGQTIWNVIRSVGEGLKNIWNIISGVIRGIGEKIWNGIQGIVNKIREFADHIRQTLMHIWRGLVNFFTKIKTIFGTLKDAFVSFIKDPLGTIWRAFQNYIVPALQWLVDKAKGIIFAIAGGIKSVFEVVWVRLAHLFGSFVGWIDNIFIRPFISKILLGRGSPEFVAYVAPAAVGTAGLLLTGMRKMFEAPEELTYERAWENALKFVSLTVGMGYLQMLSGYIEDIISRVLGIKIAGTGMGRGRGGRGGIVERAISTIYWATGMGWLTWMVFGPMFRMTISDPIIKYYTEKYRPELPTRSMVEEWLHNRLITTDEAKTLLAKLGYREEYIRKIIMTTWKVPALSYIEDMITYGIISDSYALWLIKKLGYDDAHATFLLNIIKFRSIKEQRGKYINNIYKKYKYGMLTRNEARSELLNVGLPTIIVDWMIKAADIEKEMEIYDEYIKGAIDMFVKGYIGEEELRDELSKYIKDAEMIDAIIFRASVRRMPKIYIPPLDKLESRYRRVDTQVKSYQAQIRRLTTLRKETEDVYNARIAYFEAIKKAIEDYYNTLIQALKDEMEKEFEAWVNKTTAQIDLRIQDLKKRLQTKLKAKEEVLRAYELRRKEELEARVTERYAEVRDLLMNLKRALEPYIEQFSMEGKAMLSDILSEIDRLITVVDIEGVRRLIDAVIELFSVELNSIPSDIYNILDKLDDRLTRIETLIIMQKARIEERRAKVQEDMVKEAETIDAKIEMLEKMKEVAVEYRKAIKDATLERRIKRLESYKELKLTTYDNRIKILKEEMDKTLKAYDERIAYLRIKYDYYVNELEAIRSTIVKYYPEYAEKLAM